MKKLIYILAIPLLYACSGEQIEQFEYAFKITKTLYMDGNLQDSTSYYYDDDNRLLKSIDLWYFSTRNETSALYADDTIYYRNSIYLLDSSGKVVERINDNSRMLFKYKDGVLSHEQTYVDTLLTHERFYIFNQFIPIRDSSIHYNQNDGKKYITVYNHQYSDMPLPNYVSDFRFIFYELPTFYDLQIEEKETDGINDGFKYIYTYDIKENEVVEYFDFYQESIDSITERYIMKYNISYQ